MSWTGLMEHNIFFYDEREYHESKWQQWIRHTFLMDGVLTIRDCNGNKTVDQNSRPKFIFSWIHKKKFIGSVLLHSQRFFFLFFLTQFFVIWFFKRNICICTKLNIYNNGTNSPECINVVRKRYNDNKIVSKKEKHVGSVSVLQLILPKKFVPENGGGGGNHQKRISKVDQKKIIGFKGCVTSWMCVCKMGKKTKHFDRTRIEIPKCFLFIE